MKITKEIPTEGQFRMLYVTNLDEAGCIKYEIVENRNGRKYTYAYDREVDDYVRVDDLDVPLPSYAVKSLWLKDFVFIIEEDE